MTSPVIPTQVTALMIVRTGNGFALYNADGEPQRNAGGLALLHPSAVVEAPQDLARTVQAWAKNHEEGVKT